MFEGLQFVNDLVKEFIIYIGLGLAALVGGLIRRKYNSNSNKFDNFVKENNEKLDKMQGCLDNQNERGIRHSKAILDLAEDRDEQIEILHTDTKTPKLFKKIKRNIEDEDGNL